MEDLFRSYWWLLFPLFGFAFAAWDRWLSYQRSRDSLDLVKTYTAQGKEPPAELLKQVREDDADDYDSWTGRRGRRRYRRHPRSEFRSAIFTGSLAAAFWIASEYSFVQGTEGAFRLVAVILSFIAGASLLSAVLFSRVRDK
jgi:hypothetical protein